MIFTAEQAIDAMGTRQAEMINKRTAQRICEDHGVELDEYLRDTFGAPVFPVNRRIDAGKLLTWLGY